MDKKVFIIVSLTIVGILAYNYYENKIKKSSLGKIVGL